jgi:hypothetical protein
MNDELKFPWPYQEKQKRSWTDLQGMLEQPMPKRREKVCAHEAIGGDGYHLWARSIVAV